MSRVYSQPVVLSYGILFSFGIDQTSQLDKLDNHFFLEKKIEAHSQRALR